MDIRTTPCVPAAGSLFGHRADVVSPARVAGLGSALAAWGVAVIELGPDGCIAAATPAVSRLFGCDPQALIGETIGAFLPRVEELLADAAASGRAEAVVGLAHPEGGLAAVRVHAVSVVDGDGDLVLLAPANRLSDDTSRLEEAEEWAPVMRFHADAEGRLLRATARFCQRLGRAPQALARLTLADLVHPDDRSAVGALFARIRNDSLSRFSLDVRFIGAHGALVAAHVEGKVVLDSGGRPRHAVVYVQDVTAHRQLEQELRASRDFLARVMDNVSNAVAVLDREGRFVRVNHCTTVLTGYGEAELLGRRFDDVVGAAALPALRALFAQVSRGGRSLFGEEAPIVRKDGERRLIEFNAQPMGSDAAIEAVVITAEDVTERRRAEQALRRSEEQFRNAFADAPIGMVITALDGRFLDVNPAYCALVGYSAEELLHGDVDFKRLTHPDDVPHNTHEYQRLLAGEIPAFFLEKRYVRKDGRLVWVRASASLRRDDAGRPLHVVGLVEDIDERKRGEEDRLILEAMMEHIPLGITIADAPDGRIRALSRYGRELLASPGQAPVGIAADDPPRGMRLLHADGETPATPQELPMLRALRDGERVHEEEWVLERGDGARVPILCTASPIREGSGHIIAGVVGWQDISGRKRMERTLQRMNAELEEFAFVVSHDLKAPLRAVANLALWIDEDAAALLDEENRERLRLLRERIVRMDRLIEGLLAYARLGRAASPGREAVALAPLLQQLRRDLALPAGFRVTLEEPLPTLAGDPLQLQQLFQNLIGNAAHHHDRPAQGQVTVRASDLGEVWCLEVADDGPGIPPEARERAFTMFATGAGQAGHTGIGLAVVRKIVLANGGAIAIDDHAPRGALFRIRWPK